MILFLLQDNIISIKGGIVIKKIYIFVFIMLASTIVIGGSKGLIEARATSELKPQGNNTYKAKNAIDGKLSTAWVEGKSGHGIGEKIIFDTSWEANKITAVRIYPGYGKSKSAFYNNSRVKRAQISIFKNECCTEICPIDNLGCNCDVFKLSRNQVWTKEVIFPDKMEYQTVEVPNYQTCEGDPCCTWVEIKILDVYKGAKWADTAISEVEIKYKGR